MNTQVDSVSKVYAQALFDLADDAGQIEAIADELVQIGQLIEHQDQLKLLLDSKSLSIIERQGIIRRVFEGRVSDLLCRFLQVVNKKDRLGWLAGIAVAFAKLVADKHGIVEVDVYVARLLDDNQASRIAQVLGKVLGGKEVVIHQHEQPYLVGGVKIRVGDQLIDGSVATQLKLMEQNMMVVGREKARQLSAISG